MINTAFSYNAPTCRRAGKIVICSGAVCTEPIAKAKKCPKCKGKDNIES